MSSKVPTAIRKLNGNPSRRPFNEREPKPGALRGKVEPPAWLPAGAARTHWRRLVPRLQAMQVLTEADLDAAAMLCQELATYADLIHVIATEGRTYTAPTRQGGFVVRPRPEVAMANAAVANFTRLADRFGLDPQARSRLQVEAEHDVDPLDALRDDDDARAS